MGRSVKRVDRTTGLERVTMKQFVFASILVCFSYGSLQAMLGEVEEMKLVELSHFQENIQGRKGNTDNDVSQGCWETITSWCCVLS